MEAPDLFETGYLRSGNTQLTPEKRPADSKSGDHFIVEDLFDFSNEDAVFGDDCCTFDTITGNSTESSTVTVVDSCNSSFSAAGDFSSGRNLPGGGHLSDDLSVPYDDLAELEWLSNFVEESFSSEDLQKLQLISGMRAPTTTDETVSIRNQEMLQPDDHNNQKFRPEMAVPGKARSKRSRAAPCDWSSRLLVLSPTTPPATPTPTTTTSSSESVASNSGKKTPNVATTTIGGRMKKELGMDQKGGGEGRKCLHCATEKTPQWRTGPMGPKTLCNACGVRYKSGRLVPEYRPAASPTFVLMKHSNSHRKVLELRRQRELQLAQHQQFLYPNANASAAAIFDLPNASGSTEEYLIHHHTGPDFRQLI